ncbi:P1 family peptidase [Herbiconiux sp.]|uniref:P1 family peptidase n=1 Tax=Herbiconiux sp. TaxID=1871186 RepID=UPI0025BB2129|nr:P1 family peptidase [Herbiconiux sp.]
MSAPRAGGISRPDIPTTRTEHAMDAQQQFVTAVEAARAAGGPRLVPEPVYGDGLGNADFDLTPVTLPGTGRVAFDFPGVSVGTAEYLEGPTGATVLHFDKPARTAVDARGGAIGITGKYETVNDAICLTGGSVYGLAAATGVEDELLRRRHGRVGWADLQTVSGAVIYDFGARDNAVSPDAALGRAALLAASTESIPVGRCGAGVSASAGKIDWSRIEYTGQGAAFRQVGAVKILVVTIVNPVGVVMDRDGTIVRGNYDRATGARRHPSLDYEAAFAAGTEPTSVGGNTTITCLVTNVRLADKELEHFGRQVHSSMARAIQPFHTTHDGDTLFTVTTDEVELPAAGARPFGVDSINSVGLGTIAAEVAWDAVLASSR